MFDDSIDIYDVVYAHKDYEAEATWVRDAVRARTRGARTLLAVACGTGKHLELLRHDFECQGTDLLPGFVDVAAARTGVPIHRADMDDFDLGERFDAVVCLFSAIGYSLDLDAAIASMARHLEPAGLLIVEPWFTPDEWHPGRVQVLDHEVDGVRVVRMTASGVDGETAVMAMHHLVSRGTEIEHRSEVHRMTLFTMADYERAFQAAGLSFEVDRPGPFGRGALIGSPLA